jgi:hypothetical protein
VYKRRVITSTKIEGAITSTELLRYDSTGLFLYYLSPRLTVKQSYFDMILSLRLTVLTYCVALFSLVN